MSNAYSTPPKDWSVRNLGPCTVPSVLKLSNRPDDDVPDYVPDDLRVLSRVELRAGEEVELGQTFEKAGPRELIFFNPSEVRAGVVTAGGLCPGINNVIRSLVLQLVHKYGVGEVLGYRYGFAGLDPSAGFEPMRLTPEEVRHIHTRGGTILGTSRGKHDVGAMVDTLERHGVNVLFVIGGDGTMHGAHALASELAARGRKSAVVAIPKTIDNDIAFVDRTFGFETAVSVARDAIDAAHTEASSALGGIGVVRLMGRAAGFIAANATLASRDVNVCLVPEVKYTLDGPTGLLAYLDARLATRGHAVLVVAEGCGAMLVDKDAPRDASGNIRFSAASLDIGVYLRDRIREHFAAVGTTATIKYIDPSYMIRGVAANAMDAVFCDELARHAVHAAMAGRTDVMVGRSNAVFTHVPLSLVLSHTRRIDPDHELWLAVTETTGQPLFT